MNPKLTKDADKMICEIYATYLNRRDSGIPKRAAADFVNQSDWPDEHRADWLCPDGKATLQELKAAGLVAVFLYGGFALKPEGIIYMENRFPSGLSSVLDFLGKLKPLLPF